MDVRVRDWRQRYRMRRGGAEGRLDALVRGQVLDAFHAALEHALGGDPTVYLVHSVEASCAVEQGAFANDETTARRWGEQLAAAVVRSIREDAGSGNVVCYADTSVHVAAFLQELLAGRPADSWTFAAFASLRRPTVAQTLAATLLAHSERVVAILSHLERDGVLPTLLDLLDHTTLGALQSRAAGREESPSEDADRPLFAAALRIWHKLMEPTIAPSQADAWFREFARVTKEHADWRDRTALTVHVSNGLQFLRARLPQARPRIANLETLYEEALAEFDWLDPETLRTAMKRTTTPDAHTIQSNGFRRSFSKATPKQQEILTLLHAALQRTANQLDKANLDSPRNALLLQAVVVSNRADLVGDCVPARLIELVLKSARIAAQSPQRDALLRALRDPSSPIDSLRDSTDAGALQAVIQLGPSAIRCAESLMSMVQASSPYGDEAIATDAAGTFLLLRAVADLRLPALFKHAAEGDETRAAPPMLMLLGARCAGLSIQAALDPGLSIFAGLDDESACRSVAIVSPQNVEAWAGRVQRGLAELALGHGLLSAQASLQAAVITIDGSRLLLAGCESEHVWPFVAPIAADDRVEDILAVWAATWQELTGSSLALPLLDGADSSGVTPSPSIALFESLQAGKTEQPWIDATLAVTAALLIKAWGRWLKNMANASVPYLLAQFLRRPGSVQRRDAELDVRLAPRPLDIVLQLSGYLEPLYSYSSPDRRVVRYTLMHATESNTPRRGGHAS